MASSNYRAGLPALEKKYGLPSGLLARVIQAESAWNPTAKSPVGAIGLMQLMPATAKGLGVNPYDPYQNLDGGARYLSQMYKKYKGDLSKTLAAYNAGPGAVDKYGGVPPYRETQNYVNKITKGFKPGGLAQTLASVNKPQAKSYAGLMDVRDPASQGPQQVAAIPNVAGTEIPQLVTDMPANWNNPDDPIYNQPTGAPKVNQNLVTGQMFDDKLSDAKQEITNRYASKKDGKTNRLWMALAGLAGLGIGGALGGGAGAGILGAIAPLALMQRTQNKNAYYSALEQNALNELPDNLKKMEDARQAYSTPEQFNTHVGTHFTAPIPAAQAQSIAEMTAASKGLQYGLEATRAAGQQGLGIGGGQVARSAGGAVAGGDTKTLSGGVTQNDFGDMPQGIPPALATAILQQYGDAWGTGVKSGIEMQELPSKIRGNDALAAYREEITKHYGDKVAAEIFKDRAQGGYYQRSPGGSIDNLSGGDAEKLYGLLTLLQEAESGSEGIMGIGGKAPNPAEAANIRMIIESIKPGFFNSQDAATQPTPTSGAGGNTPRANAVLQKLRGK